MDAENVRAERKTNTPPKTKSCGVNALTQSTEDSMDEEDNNYLRMRTQIMDYINVIMQLN